MQVKSNRSDTFGVFSREDLHGFFEKLDKSGWQSTQDKKRIFLKGYASRMGNVSFASRAAGIHRETYYDWMKKDSGFAEAVESIRQMEYDFVEDKLKEKIIEGSEKSVHFYLKHKHPDYRSNKTTKITEPTKTLEDLLDGMD